MRPDKSANTLRSRPWHRFILAAIKHTVCICPSDINSW